MWIQGRVLDRKVVKISKISSSYSQLYSWYCLYFDHQPRWRNTCPWGIGSKWKKKDNEILYFHNFTKKTPKLKILICIFVKYFLWTFPWVDFSSRSDLSSKCIVDIVYNSIFIFQPIFIRICFAMKGWCLSMTGTLCPSLIQTVTPSPTTRGSGNTFTPGPADLRIRYILM